MTVITYSISIEGENAMSKSDFRMVYKPAPDRLPRWVWRVWGWF